MSISSFLHKYYIIVTQKTAILCHYLSEKSEFFSGDLPFLNNRKKTDWISDLSIQTPPQPAGKQILFLDFFHSHPIGKEKVER